MEKIAYLKVFCRQGRIMIANCEELNALLPDKKDHFMIVPVLFDTEHAQVREIDAELFSTLLPNTIISSPYQPYLDNNEKPENCLNSKPFSVSKLLNSAKELASKFSMSKLMENF